MWKKENSVMSQTCSLIKDISGTTEPSLRYASVRLLEIYFLAYKKINLLLLVTKDLNTFRKVLLE